MTQEDNLIPNAHFEILSKDNFGLTEGFSVNPDSCTNSDYYPNYLRLSAIADQNAGISTTHIFINDTDKAVMGFITLRASSVIERIDDQLLGKPALEIYVLAVSEKYTHKGVGRALINCAIAEATHLNERHIGIQNIVLASDELAVDFYRHMGFAPFTDTWDRVLPRDNCNTDCTAMYMELNFENYEQFLSYDDDESEDD